MSCNTQYKSLSTYSNNGGLNFAGNSIPVASANAGYMLIPQYGGIGYDALVNVGGPSGNKYFSITTAYGQNSGASCGTKYAQEACQ